MIMLPVSAGVRDFYNRYPYPRPVDSLEKYQKLWQDPQRRHADFHLFWPGQSFREDFSILIAGCGTSQAAKHAMRWPEARVTGIDFSETSVRHTEDLKRKHNLTNLEVYRLPIEQAGELGKTFDQIVCTGVLHHLHDPDAGLTSLRNILKPEGAMHLMVYAPYGRTGIYMLQDFCRRVGIQATDEGIRDLIIALKGLPRGHPLENLLREAPDFRNDAELADALLNPQDRAYTVPQLFDFIKCADLTFGRWIKQAPYSIHCGVMAQIPQASRLADLLPAEQYAAIELYRGTMIRHSAIVYRNDHPGGSQQISFKENDWLGYIPMRMTDTICIQEKLPPGAVAVLINRTHTCRDLFMPIDDSERRIFDMINGESSIDSIIENAFSLQEIKSKHDKVRAFFERLYWNDQVVFDTSRKI